MHVFERVFLLVSVKRYYLDVNVFPLTFQPQVSWQSVHPPDLGQQGASQEDDVSQLVVQTEFENPRYGASL
jgi:hypothetical protein